MVTVIKWSMKKFVDMVVAILLNKFDCIIIIEGNRGLGKSSLAYRILKRVSGEMKRREIDGYRFSPKKALLYTRREVINFFHKWQTSGIADELINVTFNRDFYDENQKDLIKMMNMNRDHCNLFVACVPQFQTIDNQVKNLCKIRLTVLRRGLAIVQTPNRSIYSKDRWDQAINERIERKWIEKGLVNPQYSKLTTFKGVLRFPKLSDREEALYQRIKDEKRNIVAKEQMGIDDDEEEKSPLDVIYQALLDGKIKNTAMLEGMGLVYDLKPSNLKSRLRRKLKDNHKKSALTTYYYDEKEKEQADEMAEIFD